jgi:hypothetical protein
MELNTNLKYMAMLTFTLLYPKEVVFYIKMDKRTDLNKSGGHTRWSISTIPLSAIIEIKECHDWNDSLHDIYYVSIKALGGVTKTFYFEAPFYSGEFYNTLFRSILIT